MKNFNPDICPPDPAIAKAVTAGLFWHPNLQPGMDRSFPLPAYLHLPRTPGLPVLEEKGARLPFTSLQIYPTPDNLAHKIIFSYPELSRSDSNSSLELKVFDEVPREKSRNGTAHGGSLCVAECVLPEGIIVKHTDPLRMTFPYQGQREEQILGFREHGLAATHIGQAVLNAVSGFRPNILPSVTH